MTELESIKILEEKRIDYRLIELKDKAISVEDVIKYAKEKINPDEICKTIILKDKKRNNWAIFLLGNQRIDFSKARRVIGKNLTIANYEDVKKATGIELGAICPLLLKMPIFVDKRVFEKEKINFGSGDHLYGLEISSKDLGKLIDFKIINIAE